MATLEDGVVGSEGGSARCVSFLRSEWIEEEMERRLEEFAEVHEVRVVCGSWNANGTTEAAECTNRGLCDTATGVCQCFKGYTDDNCSRQSVLAA